MKLYLAGVPGGGWIKRERIKSILEQSSLELLLLENGEETEIR
jgi:hypothetical protein